MKPTIAFMFLVVVLATLYLSAEGTSPMKCGECARSECRKLDCECGSYLDQCECCSLCKKCKGEECLLIRMDVCADNLKCTFPEGMSPIDKMNTAGVCA